MAEKSKVEDGWNDIVWRENRLHRGHDEPSETTRSGLDIVKILCIDFRDRKDSIILVLQMLAKHFTFELLPQFCLSRVVKSDGRRYVDFLKLELINSTKFLAIEGCTTVFKHLFRTVYQTRG